MLKKIFTVGRLIALVTLCVVIYFAWGYIFPPGGTGANVAVGLGFAVFMLFAMTGPIGDWLDRFLMPEPRRKYEDLRNSGELLKLDVQKNIQTLLTEDKAPLNQLLLKIQETLDAATILANHKNYDEASAFLSKEVSSHESVFQEHIKDHKEYVSFAKKWLGFRTFLVFAVVMRLFIAEPFQIPSVSMVPSLLVGDHLFVWRASYGIQMPFAATPKYIVRWAYPQPGDVVVFTAPPWVPVNAGATWVKRVIATEGQKIKLRDGLVYINDQAQSLVTPAEGARIPDNIGVLYHYSDYDDENQRWMERVASLSLETIQNYQHLMLWNIPAIHKEFPDSRQLEFQSSWQLNGLTCTMEECTVNQGYIFVMGDNRDNSADGRMWGAVPVDNIKGKAKFVWLSVDGSKQSISLGRFTLPGFRSERHMMGIR